MQNMNGRKAIRNSSQDTPKWEAARAANTNQTPVTAKVDSVATKDGRPRGLNVTLDCGLPSFIPGSELPKGVNQTGLVGQTITVKVVEVNRRKGRLISSLKAVVDEARSARFAGFAEGTEVTGTVVRFKEGLGYFVDLGDGIDALLHFTQTALVSGKPEVLTIGQSITAKVRSVNAEEGKVAITMRKPRPEQSGRGRHGNVQQFNDRYSSRRNTPVLPKLKASPAPKPVSTEPRKLNKSTPRARKAGFEVSFSSSEHGNPFEALAKHYAATHPAETSVEAPVADTTAAAE